MNYKILVVDDELEIRDLLTEILISSGHNVQMACNGEEALRLIEAQKFDLIILDQQMPIKTGEELLVDLSKMLNRNFKIIFSTGNSKNLMELVEKNNVYHLVDYVLNKPFTVKKLNEVIEEIM